MTDTEYMRLALEYAKQALDCNEVPVGAVIVKDNKIIGYGCNSREKSKSCLGHAEINAIIMAENNLGDWRLDGCTMYVTLEPCAMCAGAIINSRIDRVVYGTSDDKCGCMGSSINLAHCGLGCAPKISKGILQNECEELLKTFFDKLRQI